MKMTKAKVHPGFQEQAKPGTRFRNSLERLQRYSHPTSVSSREPVLVALQAAIRHANRLIEAEWTDMNTSIPHWAMGLACGMVAVVILSVYTANCITNRLGRHPQSGQDVRGGAMRLSHMSKFYALIRLGYRPRVFQHHLDTSTIHVCC
ncbi:hypothetical protein COOONC_22900 [Cooperia oncophora]